MFKYLIMVLILCFALFSVFHSTAASDVGKCIRACIKMLHKLTKLRYNAIVHMQVHAQQYSSFVLLGQCAKFFLPTGEPFCQPSCRINNGGCPRSTKCELVPVVCKRAPCPPEFKCRQIGKSTAEGE